MLMESIITQHVVCFGYGEKIKGKDELTRSAKQRSKCSVLFVVVVQSVDFQKGIFMNGLIA